MDLNNNNNNNHENMINISLMTGLKWKFNGCLFAGFKSPGRMLLFDND